jgi:hypothetical protein
MKKILLLSFLFTSISFYSQIADLASMCNYYDLTRQKQLLIGNLDPNQTAITYHLSLADATNGINAIVNPEYYANLIDNTFIYTRMNSANVISTNSFKLVHTYDHPPLISTSGYTSGLGKNDGFAELTIFDGVPLLFVDVLNTTTGVHFPVPFYSNQPFQQILIPNLNLGIYECHILDVNHCTTISQFTIADDPLSFTTTITDKTITVNAIGGIPPYSYTIGNGYYDSMNVFSGLSVGTHTISVRDSSYQTLDAEVIITEPGILNATTTITNVSCYEGNNGSITITATGGNPPYTYSKDGNNYAENNTFNNLVTGTHTTYVKDTKGIVVSNVSTITQPYTPLLIDSFSASLDCQNVRSISITATGGQAPYTYSKDGINYDSYNTFSNLDSGTYTMYTKDRNGCVTTKLIPLDQPAYFYIVPSVTNVSCNGSKDGSITLSVIGGSGSYKYQMSGDVLKSDNKYSGLAAGTYTITATDSNLGCRAKASITITEPAVLNTTTAITNITCSNNGSITINATGGTAPYSYSKDGIKYDSTRTFSNLVAGTYTLYTKDNNGCISTQQVTLDQPAPLFITASVKNVSCYGDKDGSITIATTGGQSPYTYSLKNNGIPISGNQSTNIFSGLSTGSYEIMVSDVNGCLLLQSGINILQPATAVLAQVAITPISCNNDKGTISVTATGGQAPYSYSKDGVNYESTGTFSNLNSGAYSLYTKDSNGCLSIQSVKLDQPTPLSITPSVKNLNCKGSKDGSITLTTTGGSGSYYYSINGGATQNSNVFSGLSAGTYAISATDTNSCTATITVTITEPAPLQTTILIDNQTITVNTLGGTAPYQYSIDGLPYLTGNTISNVTPGIITINTRDAKGCITTSTNNVVYPPIPKINGNIVITVSFKLGQTLADIILEIQNMKWYISLSASTSKTSKITEDPLPLSTLIQNNATYYVSQTINGVESIERLTVHFSESTLETPRFDLSNFAYYPNPVKDILTISNTSIIDEAILFSVKGEALLTKKINSLNAVIDLSNFTKGVYFLKVKAEGTEKTVKLIKE